MGDPKRPRKKYASPRNPWRADQLSQELYLVGTFGLRNKRELQIIQTELSRIRKQARTLLAAQTDVRAVEEKKFLRRLHNMGLVGSEATLDDVLGLTVENLLERRLQSLVARKGLAKSPYQARQMITHGHIEVVGRVVTVPSYLVKADEEASLAVKAESSLRTVAQPSA